MTVLYPDIPKRYTINNYDDASMYEHMGQSISSTASLLNSGREMRAFLARMRFVTRSSLRSQVCVPVCVCVCVCVHRVFLCFM